MFDRNDTLVIGVAALCVALMSTQSPAATPPGGDPAKGDASKASAASANPTFANPDTPGLMDGKPAPDVANTSDIVFMKQIAIGSRAEVELGKLAADRSKVSGIDEYGRHMVKDHGDANSRLASLARGAKVDLPKDLDAEHAAVRQELQSLNGKDFDLRYVESQIKDHQKAVQLLIYEIGSGQHVGVRQFAADTLPKVMQHLERAKELHSELTGAGPPKGQLAP
jgi:putative membrane protein